ncbi:MAG: universal stress protein [Verrucomicrobia bacterium]|nr:universal stress protein [Verrucomicrobiota bacterium]
MPTIITCTDGSLYAPSVYDLSAWAARRMHAGIHVLHMLDFHRERAQIADFSGSIGVDAREALMQELVALEEAKGRVALNKGRAILSEAERQIKAAGIERVKTEQRHGALVETLEEMEQAADMVVIGRRGESADFAKLHLGGNVERVIRSSIRPVLIASRKFVPIEKFLIAFDGSPSAKKAVAYAVEQPLLKGLECHLLMVGHSDAGHNQELESARSQLAEAGYAVVSRHLSGDVEKVIAEVIQAEKIQLLVMGAYGHSRIRQLIVGSTTTTMVRTSLVPVLMFR